MEKYSVDGVIFVREKQSNGEKGLCVGCAFNTPDEADLKSAKFGEGCVKYGEVCDVDKTGNMVVFKTAKL